MLELWPTVIAPLVAACRPASMLVVGPDPDLHARALRTAEELGSQLWVVAPDELLAAADTASRSYDLVLVPAVLPAGTVRRILERLVADAAGAGRSLPLTVVACGLGDALPGVETFVAAREAAPRLVHLPGFGGLAIVVDPDRAPANGALDRLLSELSPGPVLGAHLVALDAAHAREQERANLAEAKLEEVGGELDRHVEVVAGRDRLRARLRTLAEDRARLLEAAHRGDPESVPEAVRLEREAGEHVPRRLAALRADVPELALPTPRDLRRMLVGDDAAPHVVIRAVGSAAALRACMWSVIDRADRPLRVSVAVPGDARPEVRELIAELTIRLPALERIDLPSDDGGSWSASVAADGTPWLALFDRPAVAPHGWLARVDALVGTDPLAAPGTVELRVPASVGVDAIALAADAAGREPVSSPVCRLLPAGVEATVVPERGSRVLVLDDGRGAPSATPGTLEADLRARLAGGPRIAYLLSGLPPDGSGGALSVLQEAAALAAVGVDARIAIPTAALERGAALNPASASLLRPYAGDDELGAVLADADIVVATEANTVEVVAGAVPAESGRLHAYYVQDYEALFARPDSARADAATLSYRRASAGGALFAKTHWLANLVASSHGVPVAKVDPSLDTDVFHARGRPEARAGVRVVAMIRPRTPRRRPSATLALLEKLASELGDRVECVSFGSTMEEVEAIAGGPPVAVHHLGVLGREQVAEVMRQSDAFVDLSIYQAFGRSGLEAMACGAVPVLPRAGGAVEFATDGENALLADGPEAALAAVRTLVDDRDRLAAMRAAGIRRAEDFSLLRSAMSQYAFLTAALASRRAGQEGLVP